MDFYQDGGNSSAYQIFDIEVDSSSNQYLIYSNGTRDNLFVTKKSSNGSYDWSFEYPTIDILAFAKSAILSSDGNTLRIIGDVSNGT